MTDAMRARAAKFAARVAARKWEYRQRDLAHGVWFRLRRVLALAETVREVSDDVMDGLVAAGAPLEPVGGELEPPKRIVVVPHALASSLEARVLAVRLSAELLGAKNLVLTPFTPAASTRPDRSASPSPSKGSR
jgi:hypothetical protein